MATDAESPRELAFEREQLERLRRVTQRLAVVESKLEKSVRHLRGVKIALDRTEAA